MDELTHFLGDLGAPGRTLVFCDETDITQGEPASNMVANVHMRAAIIMTSERYAAAAAALDERSKALGIEEFHANEIVNPTKKSPWRDAGIAARIDALRLACNQLLDVADAILYVHVAKQQYEDFRAADQTGRMPSNHKSGVKQVFLNSLPERLLNNRAPLIVMDKEKPGPPTPLRG